jgi:signal transduction histidine kinase/AraC-like DNA-binding protein
VRDPTKYCGLISLLLLFLSFQTFPQAHIQSGNVNGKWIKQNSPFYIDGEIKIPRGKKLLIEAGVKVIFTGHYKLIVNGILEARGTKQDSIYFFPSDTSVGWHGIRFIEAEDFNTLAYCVLRNGKTDRVLEDGDYEKCKADPDCDENDYDGGAILIIHSNPIISNSLITENKSAMHGAITIKNKSNPQINFCEIKDNIGGEGTGIHCENSSNPIIKNSIISGNIGGMGAGISFQAYCSPIIDGCIIKNNTSDYRAGGICFYTNSKPVVRNSIISDNKAVLGGGIFIDEFYNVFREQVGKIDIQITNTRIENNSAEYGGGIWLRDAMGKFSNVTVCNNTASIAGGGIHIEYNPFLFKFSSEYPCNIFMNFARIMGNDLFRLGGGNPMAVPIDTFTVKYYSALNAEPVDKFPLTIKNFKLTQVNADLYVSPEGDDNNSGQSPDESLKTLRIALLRILADSTNPRTIYMGKGEYVFDETNDILLLGKHKYVSVKGAGFTDVIFGTDRITVFTPWWITTWALIIYSSVVIGIIILMVSVRTRRFKIKSELEKKEFEAKKLHEVDEIKMRFFTNISHEFRTPLTLILGPAKQLSEQLKDEAAKTKADLIHRSAKNLNRLVDELLDISKIESGEMRLKACPLNLVKIVKESALSFSSLAERRKITFNINSTVDELIAYVDRNKVDKILSNVLSNAFKFTPEGGKVEVSVEGSGSRRLQPAEMSKSRNLKVAATRGKDVDSVEIIITDTGIGIPENQIDKIFDRFYQVDGSHTREHEGTGIGLALTKELVELHKGRIEVESKEGKGSKFKIIFPLGKTHLKPEDICEELCAEDIVTPEPEETNETKDLHKPEIELSEKPTLLIAEDNPDVRNYISMILGNEYRIFEAKDGEEGLDKAVECIPELIISDVMMPKMDGFQLCRQLKTDFRTSHIPVIMLTAKATMQDKINGLEIGADEYIMKPFDADELKARIKNLLEQRKRLHEYFNKYGFVDTEKKNITSADQKFLAKVVSIIDENIPDTSFGVEVLAEKIAVSHSLLYKKINSLTGTSPSELIKKLRLNKAAKLIESNTGNISEIALEVGFNNPSYFADCFKKQFGVAPSQYHSSASKKGKG